MKHCSKASLLQEEAQSDSIPKQEADAEGVLTELATAFDPSCKFHLKNQEEQLPKAVEQFYERSTDTVARNFWAAATPNPAGRLGSTDEDDSNEIADTVDLTLDAAPQHEWLAFLISYFAQLGGLDAMAQASRL